MTINDVEFSVDCFDIISELRNQLQLNNVSLFAKIIDTPNNVQVCCPYHKNGQERRPSAGIRKSDGLFHCFACGETHTMSEMISHCFGKYEDVLGKFGWQWLLKNFVTIQVEERNDIELDFNRSIGISRVHTVDNNGNIDSISNRYVTEEELDEYRYYHPYWRKRGIVDSDIVYLFDLGYDSKTDCITMPVRDVKGNTLFVARRSVKTKFFNYPKDVDKPLYGLYEYNLHQHKSIMWEDSREWYTKGLEVFICESMIDALLLWQAGFYAFALNGLGSSRQIDELKKLPIRKYILCTDNDSAGQRAREVLRSALKNKLITEIMFPSNRKDVGECTEKEIENILEWEKL